MWTASGRSRLTLSIINFITLLLVEYSLEDQSFAQDEAHYLTSQSEASQPIWDHATRNQILYLMENSARLLRLGILVVPFFIPDHSLIHPIGFEGCDNLKYMVHH